MQMPQALRPAACDSLSTAGMQQGNQLFTPGANVKLTPVVLIQHPNIVLVARCSDSDFLLSGKYFAS
jgi:hypothetical protein